MDKEVIRALTGNYQDIILNRSGLKCYGYRVDDNNVLDDLGLVNTAKDCVDILAVFDFLREDIVTFQPLYNRDGYDIIKRRDGKTLCIEKRLVAKPNCQIMKIIALAIRRSLINIITTSNGVIKIDLENDKIKVSDKGNNMVIFEALHYSYFGNLQIIDYMLENVSKHNDITIGYLFDKPVSVDITVFNTKFMIRGDETRMLPLIKKSADYKEILRNVNRHQLKMEDFKYEK